MQTLSNIVPEAAVYLGNRDVCSIANSTVFNNNPDSPCVSGLTAGPPTDSLIAQCIKATRPSNGGTDKSRGDLDQTAEQAPHYTR